MGGKDREGPPGSAALMKEEALWLNACIEGKESGNGLGR